MAAAETRKVRYAVVGAGNIAQVAVLPAFAHATENSELVALISGDPQKRDELGKRYRLSHAGDYDELERVLTQARVDAVYIATSNDRHRELSERAAASGVHVLCEKPMAPRVADCEAMLEAAARSHVKLMIAYRLHFEEANLRAIEAVRGGVLGTPKLFSSVFTQQVRSGDIRTQAKTAGGALFDMGVYPINTARNLFRDEPIEVMAMIPSSSDRRFAQVDETVSVLLRFPAGEIAQLTASMGAAAQSSYRVVGSLGELRVDPAFDYNGESVHHLTVDDNTTRRVYARSDQFAPELIYFSRCILEDSEPEPSGEEGLADVRVCEAALESARTGRAVHLPVFQRSARPDLRLAMRKPPVRPARTVHAPSPTQRP
jgi:predicted dehydrogenase